ncbi:hypothetical protein [Pseudoponticoccus marisrubri]|uniref:hypothetical protein n=1 Tax=Pseudoponticoccus marisrubri TaxID=1685382 RepID=UPI0012FE3148|nr:hypothetical protein [Pseudoponticoccus marisrubri]
MRPLRPRVDIPVCDPAPDVARRTALAERGRFLGRQEAWEEMAQMILEAEAERRLTPGLTPVASLLALGARSDVMHAVEGAVARNDTAVVHTMLGALEANLEERPDCPATGYVVAATHVDVAQAWRGAADLHRLAPVRRDAHDRHMRAAAQLVDRFDPFECHSPLWAMIRCAVLDVDPAPAQRVCDDYEDLLELDPGCPDHLVSMGRDLLPRRFGTWEVLDREARRAVVLTRDIWNMGGYAWVYIGALEADPGAFRRLDAELFVEGLHDILARAPGQHMANRMAAFCGLTLAGPAQRGSTHERLHHCFAWIAQDHLRELHPVVWATAPARHCVDPGGIAEDDLVRRGRARAISSLAAYYAPALDVGRRLVFTPEGIEMPRIT